MCLGCPSVTEEWWGGVLWSEDVGVSHQNPVLWFATPGVLFDGSHKLNRLFVQRPPDALWEEERRKKKGWKGRANYIT